LLHENKDMTAVDDMFRWPVRRLAQHLRDGSVSARAVLDHYLARIERLNPRLNAITFLDPRAQIAADDSDRRFLAGRPRSLIDGIPVAIKDNLLVYGQPAVWGSRLYAEHVSDRDELPIALLRDAGAVILGKTNVPEFTLGGFTDNPVFGATRNPWDLTLTPGGSSGGSAAAVAAGLVPLALGTDGGGSIRRPAGHTGLVGLKPSIARIPRADGFPAILLDCEVVGPLARTVDDVRIVLACLARPHPSDQRSRGLPTLAQAGETRGPRRILLVERFGDAPVDGHIAASSRKAAENLAALGHHVTTGPLPLSIDAVSAAWNKIGAVGLAMLAQREPRFFELASPDYQDLARAGAKVSGGEYLEIVQMLDALRAETGRVFASIDVIVTPTAAAQPWPASEPFPPMIEGHEAGPRGHAVFTGWVNACGHPALAIPVDPAPDGMPIGLQLVGDFGAEGLLLDLAEDYETRHPWADRWPAIALG
jgi:aspartyl-tRNA(Asn)/glutamyl-tRNA(Gln) amidotransferase subunit A